MSKLVFNVMLYILSLVLPTCNTKIPKTILLYRPNPIIFDFYKFFKEKLNFLKAIEYITTIETKF